MREVDRARKRERILKAAIHVFARHGFFVSRVSQIADAAGVADGTIYLYFHNKDDILISIFEDRIDALCTVIRKAVADLDDPAEKLRRVIDLQLGIIRRHRDLAEVLSINLRQSTRFLKQFAAPKFNRYLDLIAEIVREGQQKGIFREDVGPRVFACSLFGALDGLTLTWVIGKGRPERLQRAADAAATILIEGIRKRPAEIPRRRARKGGRP
ncbi:MAG: TetR/AcrR family transcriptional regulator [Deltaproteobacteria bacterium]|nr:TetR/AcrR family transcriptional regulator [Deltaproteobacteria bacterium]